MTSSLCKQRQCDEVKGLNNIYTHAMMYLCRVMKDADDICSTDSLAMNVLKISMLQATRHAARLDADQTQNRCFSLFAFRQIVAYI